MLMKEMHKEVEVERVSELNNFNVHLRKSMRSKKQLHLKIRDYQEILPEYGKEKRYSCYASPLDGPHIRSPGERLVSDMFKNAPLDIAGLNRGDSTENIIPSIITYLKRKVSDLKSKKKILEVLMESEEKGMTMKKNIQEYKKRKINLETELDRMQQEKSEVIHSLDHMHVTLSREEENKLDSARHNLEMKTILLQFDVYSIELTIYLEIQKHDRKLVLMSSDLFKINQELCDTEEILKQCVLADLEVKRELSNR